MNITECRKAHRKLWSSIFVLEYSINNYLLSIEAYINGLMKKEFEEERKPLLSESIYCLDTMFDQIIQLQKFLLKKTYLCFQFKTISHDAELIKKELECMEEKECELLDCKDRISEMISTWRIYDLDPFFIEEKLSELSKYYKLRKEILLPREIKYEEPAPPWVNV